jgi:hypothetical protein
MKNFIFFLLAFVVTGTYHNNITNDIKPYKAQIFTATPQQAVAKSVYTGQITNSRERDPNSAARSRKEFPNPHSKEAVEAYKAYLNMNHISKKECECYEKLIFKESSWNPMAKNPKSTAFGLGQFLDKTWDLVPHSKTTNPYDQLDAMFIYVEKRHGSGCKAWEFWLRNNWY